MKLRADPMSFLKLQALKLLFLSPRPRSLLPQASHLIARPPHLPKRCVSRSDSTEREWTPQVRQPKRRVTRIEDTSAGGARPSSSLSSSPSPSSSLSPSPSSSSSSSSWSESESCECKQPSRCYTGHKCLLAQRLTIMGTPC